MVNTNTRRIGAIVLCGAIVAAALSGCAFFGSQQTAEEPGIRQISVQTVSPELGKIAVSGEYIGKIEPGEQVYVIPKVAGEVTAVNYKVGDTVQAGATLFTIDDTALRYTFNQASTALSLAEAKLGVGQEMAQHTLDSFYSGLTDGTNTALIQAEAGVKQAENAVQQTTNGLSQARKALREHQQIDENDFNYMAQMLGLTTDYDSAMSQYRNAVTQTELAVEAANIALETAKSGLAAAKSGMNDQEYALDAQVRLAELNADLSDQRIALAQVQTTLGYYSVSAPISGVVEQRSVEPHGMATQASPAFVISNKESMVVTFNVPETSLASLQVGDSILAEKNGKYYNGIVTEITTMASPQTGLFKIKSTLSDAADLLSGTNIKIIMDTRKADNCILIPIDAVQFENGAPIVYIATGNTATKVHIETGISNATMIQVVSGLSLTDRVILTWTSHLVDGAQILLPGTAAPASAGDTTDQDDETDSEAAAQDGETTQADLPAADSAGETAATPEPSQEEAASE